MSICLSTHLPKFQFLPLIHHFHCSWGFIKFVSPKQVLSCMLYEKQINICMYLKEFDRQCFSRENGTTAIWNDARKAMTCTWRKRKMKKRLEGVSFFLPISEADIVLPSGRPKPYNMSWHVENTDFPILLSKWGLKLGWRF